MREGSVFAPELPRSDCEKYLFENISSALAPALHQRELRVLVEPAVQPVLPGGESCFKCEADEITHASAVT